MFWLLLLALGQLPDTTPRPGLGVHFDVYWTGHGFVCRAPCYTATKPDGGLYPNLLEAEDGNAQSCIDKLRTRAAANCGR